ncbi:MAG: hypothetical protein V3U43_04170 [Pseudomonadales bacterium]
MFTLVMAFLTMAGCQGPGSISEVGKYVPNAELTAALRAKVQHADVLVVFADIRKDDDKMYCPVAAITVDDQCDSFSSKDLDIVCRWAKDSGKASELRRVKWQSVIDEGEGRPVFSIVFPGAAGDAPCQPWAPPTGANVVTCNAKNAADLGLTSPGDEVKKEYDVTAKYRGKDCPTLDPYIIFRR